MLNPWDREVIVTPLNQEGLRFGQCKTDLVSDQRVRSVASSLRGIPALVREVDAFERWDISERARLP